MRWNLVRLICCCLVVTLLLAVGVPRAEAQGVGYDGSGFLILAVGIGYGVYLLVKTLASETPSDTRPGGSEGRPSEPGTPSPAPFINPISPPGL